MSHCARGDHTAGPRAVQQPELDAAGVGNLAHDAAERVDLAHQVALGHAADGGVAAHLRDQVEIQREQGRAQAHPRGGGGGLAARVSPAYDQHIELFRKGHGSILEAVRLPGFRYELDLRGGHAG